MKLLATKGWSPLIGFVVGFVVSTMLSNLTWMGNSPVRVVDRVSDRDNPHLLSPARDSLSAASNGSVDGGVAKSENMSTNVDIPLKPHEHVVVDDSKQHVSDNNTAADILKKKVRILCWIMTSPATLESRAVHVRKTWGKRCDVLLFASDTEDKEFPTIAVETETGREHLTSRTMKTFDYVHAHHLDDADWFMKADDDTYVIVENLRYFLSGQDPSQPLYFGHHFAPEGFKKILPNGYESGGAGYVVSKQALKLFATRNESLCAKDGGPEDVKFGECMHKLEVTLGDSRDALNRTRFHCLPLGSFVHGHFPQWLRDYDRHGILAGSETISDYPITFHYVGMEQMYLMEHYVYHLRPYGVQTGLQNLNRP